MNGNYYSNWFDLCPQSISGIEFWSNVCDEEVDLEIERSEAEELGKPPENVSRFYAKVIWQISFQ